jgi:hypothetical protein
MGFAVDEPSYRQHSVGVMAPPSLDIYLQGDQTGHIGIFSATSSSVNSRSVFFNGTAIAVYSFPMKIRIQIPACLLLHMLCRGKNPSPVLSKPAYARRASRV